MAQSIEAGNKQSLLETTILLGVIEGRDPHVEIALKNIATQEEIGKATRRLLADQEINFAPPYTHFPQRTFEPGVEYQLKPLAR